MTQAVQEFIEKMRPIAAKIEADFGIKPLITMTQAAHESRWGQSDLTVKANNLFGFTGESWAAAKKPVIYMKTREFVKGKWIDVQRPFRAYVDWESSVRDWARLMLTPHYAAALAAAIAGNLPSFATAVACAGYATDPNYAGRLVAVSDRVNEALA